MLDRWIGEGMITNLDRYDLSETILSIWDKFGHNPAVDLEALVGEVLFTSEVQPFREWIASMEGARGLYGDWEEVQSTLSSEGGRRFIVASGNCWFAMIENGIPGLAADEAEIIKENASRNAALGDSETPSRRSETSHLRSLSIETLIEREGID